MADADEVGRPDPRTGTGDLSRALTYASSLDAVLEIVVERAATLAGASRALVMLADDEGLLRIRAARGVPEEDAARFHEPLDETLVRRLTGLLGEDAKGRFLGVPLVVRGSVIGLLAVLRDRSDPVQEEEERLLSAIADQAAVALGSARLEQRARTLAHRVTELEHARSSQDHVLQVVSHDLRSPLNAIGGYVQLLRTGILGDVNERQRETLGRIEKVLEHLEALVSDVLEAVRPGQEEERGAAERLDVSRIVEETLNVVGPSADEAGIRVEVDVPRESAVLAHPDRLRQVLVHLVDNAVKYAPRDSTVRIGAGLVEREGRAWRRVTVEDRGPGIPEDRQEDIFQPYERLASSGGEGERSGVGLGLAIARQLVRRMDGELGVESVPGQGATFVVYLPAE